MARIMRGDQYGLPITIKRNGHVVDDSVDDLIIKVGEVAKHKNELEFSGGKWFYPLESEKTYEYPDPVAVQCAIKIGTNVIETDTRSLSIKDSIITLEELEGNNDD